MNNYGCNFVVPGASVLKYVSCGWVVGVGGDACGWCTCCAELWKNLRRSGVGLGGRSGVGLGVGLGDSSVLVVVEVVVVVVGGM